MPAQGGARGSDFVGAERRAMRFVGAGGVRARQADDRLAADQRGLADGVSASRRPRLDAIAVQAVDIGMTRQP